MPIAEKKVTPDDFNFMKVLGKGNYGKVLQGWIVGTTKQYEIIKIKGDARHDQGRSFREASCSQSNQEIRFG